MASGRREQQLFQAALITIFWQRPRQARSGKSLQITMDYSLADAATLGNLFLRESEVVTETEQFFGLPHGQPFLGHEGFLHQQWKNSPPGCPASAPSDIRLLAITCYSGSSTSHRNGHSHRQNHYSHPVRIPI